MNSLVDQIVLFGDSITQFSFNPDLHGWGAYIADAYQRKFDVMNRGFSGYNTDWALPILRQLLPTTEDQKKSTNRIRLITIFFGANDASLPFAYQHVPITRYTENLSEMFNMIQNPNSKFYNPDAKIILITQPPVNEVQWKKRCDDNGDRMNRTAEVAKAYAEAAREIAGQHQVPVCDLWTELMQIAGLEAVNGKEEGVEVTSKTCYAEEKDYKRDLSEFLLDGLHLNSNGNKLLAQVLLKTIDAYYPELSAEAVDLHLPIWRDVPQTNYEESLQYKTSN
ncbi:hypothetical protein INT44_005426 [Umbelopsis vinacea]|uniref:SGNH hydrolase-type esterase domain-containing protein n=1 Tax=Umbelopsis vinacea TaxID=44442 RepID=A0A8H7Q8G5_9FUNG|nr:hypothetical protein INT44_005426 [Umbelopsis vinacea]